MSTVTEKDRKRSVWGWALYDWANSAFATTVMAGFFPVFFKQYWGAGLTNVESTYHLGVVNTVASLIIACTAPMLGALADLGRLKKPLLALFTVFGVVASAALFFTPKGAWNLAAWFFLLGYIGFSGGNIVYDALLLDVAEPHRRHRVSALGYALGYLGGGLLFALNVVMAIKPTIFGLNDAAQGVRLSFLLVAGWWAIFSVPLFIWMREVGGTSEQSTSRSPSALWRLCCRSLVQLIDTCRHVMRLRNVFLFLLAYWFYIDGVHTIMRMAVDYGLSIGLPSNSLIVALLVTQFVGLPATLLFGKLGDRFGAKFGIYIGIVVYMLVTIWAVFMRNAIEFYGLAIAIGMVQGGVQSLSRSYFADLVPSERGAEFFGFYNMLGKFASIIGPLLMGWVGVLSGNPRLSILSIIILFVIGIIFLSFVDRAATPQPNRPAAT